MQRSKVLIIFGGISAEHEVSISSAASILDAIDRERFWPATLAITKEGSYVVNVNPRALIPNRQAVYPAATTWTASDDVWSCSNALELIKTSDVVFPILHGPGGEDGTIQGLLESLGKKYVGSSVLASAVCMDKAVTKDLLIMAGVEVIPYQHFTAHQWSTEREALLAKIEAYRYPVFVKPAALGSSVGISKVHNGSELSAAIDIALSYGNKVIVEQGISGREIECSVLGNNQLIISNPGEIIPNADYYDYDTKYLNDCAELVIPAVLNDQIIQQIRQLSARAYRALQCKGLARIDFFVENDTERVLINEINTMPGFTPISMFPKLMINEGMTYSYLITRLLELAVEE